MSLLSYAQIGISGIVIDKNKDVISYANITIHNLTTSKIISYTTTDDEGNYNLSIKQGKYKFRISHLGYKSISEIKTIYKNEVLNFTLTEDTTNLDEIIIKSKSFGVNIKNDTTKYNLKKFTTGNERNLKEVLHKLPGIQIEKGKIKVNGKKIDKLLIDGKELFGDQHQLITENITPEMLKNISLLNNFKDFSDLGSDNKSDKTALNIEIQETYKGKIKGNVKIAGGNNTSFQANTNLFLFNKKTNLLFLGGINNIGKQIFSFEDYLSFQGGLKKLTGDDNVTTISADNQLPDYLLPNGDFKDKKDLFSAFNFTYKHLKKFKLNSYVIFDKINSTEQELIRQRPLSNNSNLSLNINKYKNNSFLVNNTFLDAVYKISNSSLLSYALSYSPQNKSAQILENFNTKKYNTQNDVKDYLLSQLFSYKKSSENSVFSFSLFSDFNNAEERLNLFSDKEFLNLIFTDQNFSTSQTIKKENTDVGFVSQLNQKITQKISVKLSYKLKQSSRFFKSNTIGNFNNDIHVSSNENNVVFSMFNSQNKLVNYKLGLNYKNLTINNTIENRFLPFADLKFRFKKTHSLSFGYRKTLKLPSLSELLESPLITNFNTLTANQNVFPNTVSLYDNYSLQYFIYDLFSGTLVTLGGNLDVGKNTITTNTKIASSFITDNFYSGFKENKTNAYLLVDKKFSKIKFNLRFKNSFSFNQKNNFINDRPNITESNFISNSLIVSSNFSSKFNFDLGYKKTQSNIENITLKSNITSDKPYCNFYFDLDRFNLQLKKSIIFYNSNVPNQYLLDARFNYLTANKQWDFFLEGKNILNINQNVIAQNKVYNSYIEEKIVSTMQGFIILGMKYKI